MLGWLLTVFISYPLWAAPYSVKVLTVVDGDTITVRGPDAKELRVRLSGIDAPEHRQAYADESRDVLQRMVGGKHADLLIHGADRYGRLLACPVVNAVDICAEMVRAGAAWVYRKDGENPHLIPLEEEARRLRKGLWAQAEPPTPPWEWRRARPAQATHDPDCHIKGNISGSGERIYHVPGQKNYAMTRISAGKGERWFCSEAEARSAGWRRARR